MSPRLLALYHHLPAPLRPAAASLRGLVLRRRRYGPETERLVAETLEREAWSDERWRRFQEEGLAALLHRAATAVPYYRQMWQERRRRGDRSSWERLESWPPLAKEELRSAPRAFLADGCDTRRMVVEHTSGSTGTPLVLWWSRATTRAWYALFEARCRRWHGVSREDRWAILGGQLVVPVRRRRPPFWVWNAPLRQLYLSAYHLAPDLVPAYLEALRRYRVRYLVGYPSALHALARGALASGTVAPPMELVLANAEPLFDHQRQAIAAAFAAPVRDSYGMAELAAAASECPEGACHLWPEVGIVEAAPGDAAGAVDGEVLATGLLNRDMPLVRYQVGDRIRRRPPRERCSCGRTLPLLAAIEGRADDVLYTRDGRAVGRLDPVFKGDLPVREAQIVQESLERVRLRYVAAEGFTPRAGRELAERLRQRLGDVEVVLEAVEALPRSAAGKLRSVVSRLPPGERPAPEVAAR